MRVALIDDAAVTRALFARIATGLGYEVVDIDEAGAPSEGDLDFLVRFVREAAPALAIVDGRFADPLGVASDAPARVARIVRTLRTALPDVVVGIAAALTETALVRAAADAGAGFVVARPYLRTQLAATLRAMSAEIAARRR